MSDQNCTKDPEYSNTFYDFMSVLDIAQTYYKIDTSNVPMLEDVDTKNKDEFLRRWSEVYRKILRKTHPDKNRNIDDDELKQINKDMSDLLSSLNERLKCYIDQIADGKTLGGKKTRRQKKRRQQRRKSSKRS
jgi:hypothetical protein